MKPIAEIHLHRERLVAEAARQRDVLSENYAGFEGPANVAARGIDVVAWLRKRPLVVGTIAAVLVAIRPRGAMKLAGRGLIAWRAVRSIRGFLKESGVTW